MCVCVCLCVCLCRTLLQGFPDQGSLLACGIPRRFQTLNAILSHKFPALRSVSGVSVESTTIGRNMALTSMHEDALVSTAILQSPSHSMRRFAPVRCRDKRLPRLAASSLGNFPRCLQGEPVALAPAGKPSHRSFEFQKVILSDSRSDQIHFRRFSCGVHTGGVTYGVPVPDNVTGSLTMIHGAQLCIATQRIVHPV